MEYPGDENRTRRQHIDRLYNSHHRGGRRSDKLGDDMVMNTFEVWCEGYHVQEGTGRHWLVDTVKAKTFKEACDIAFANPDQSEGWRECYNSEKLSHWGCRLFDNASEAAEKCG
jgi:hypothetical protein